MNDHTTRRPYNMSLADTVQWFVDNHVTVTESDCWEMPGIAHYPDGYPAVSFGGGPQKAHRLFYAAMVGEIPDGVHVCHACDNPACVNPEHLWLGTSADNMADKMSKGRGNQPRGEQSSAAKLTEADVRNIRKLYDEDGVSVRDLSEAYGVTSRTIYFIVRGQTWTGVSYR